MIKDFNLALLFCYRMLLRDTMVAMGITVGYPKLVLMDKTIQYLNQVDEKADVDLFAQDMDATELDKIWNYIAKDVYQLDGRQRERQELEPVAEWKEWVPYTIGATLQDSRLVSPEQLFLSNLDTVQKAWRTNLAELFHQVYLFLPISPLDELKDRLISLVTEMGPNEDGMIPTVVEVMEMPKNDFYCMSAMIDL